MNVGLEGGLFLYKSHLVSPLCHWIFGVVGSRGLLYQYPLAGSLLFGKILLARILHAVNERGLM
jgi:hypothetical protein